MVKRIVNTQAFDSFVFAALILCVCFYSGMVKAKNHYFFKTLAYCSDATFYGKIDSSPVKVVNVDGESSYYKADFCVFSIEKRNGECFSCDGIVQILLPASDVEAFHPGKLYSESSMHDKNAFLIEEGKLLCVKGFFSDSRNMIKCYSLSDLNSDFKIHPCCSKAMSRSFSRTFDFFKVFYEFRGKCRLKFRRLMYSWGKAGSLFLALLSGIRENLDADAAENFKLAGLSHILALSGMHLSLFSTISLNTGKLIAGKKFAVLFQLFAVLAFVWFAGISPSLFRALLCTLIAVFLRSIKIFSINQFKILCIAFLIHACVFPYHLFEVSFMLSYGALAGILLFGKMFTSLAVFKLPCMLANSIGSSTAAITFTSPVTYIKMGTFSPIGIISTTVVSPLINCFIYSGLLFFVLSFCFPFLLSCNAFFMQFQYNIIVALVGFFSSISIF